MREAAAPGQQLKCNGFAFLPRFRSELTSAAAFGLLGQIDAVDGFEAIQTLTPHHAHDAAPNTYSGNFGTGEFPLHTDLAHWAVPPRYVALRCVSGLSSVGTTLLDGFVVAKAIGRSRLRMALVQPRRPLRNGLHLLRLLDTERSDGSDRFRWDSIFLKPANAFAATVIAEVSAFLARARTGQAVLTEPGDTLLLDNWRLLHGRTPVSSAACSRRLNRAYLEALHI